MLGSGAGLVPREIEGFNFDHLAAVRQKNFTGKGDYP